MDKPLTPNTRKLVEALLLGPVKACGGVAYHPKDNRFMMLAADIRDCITELATHGIRVGRTDAGGTPTWDVTE